MSVFRIDRTTPLSAEDAWRRLTDWPAHAAQVPLTRITVLTPGPTRAGTVFVARTGLGRAAFDDPMEVVRWQPPAPGRPGHCRLEKRGTAVTGWAEIHVRQEGGAGEAAYGSPTRVRWEEELRVGPLPRLLAPLTARAGRLVFGRVVDRLLRGQG
ncbi:SRPBCC family protein [Streptomyces sp. NPDC059255]|uniref:SRPBCC family protein n=1 Tax=Streptomyces sp. NPDC059255 TaxID=3346793 RepID=UPI003684CB54